MYSGNRHKITVDGKTFFVDSNQEEYLILLLENSGFSKRWRRLDSGISVGRNNYTPDLELAIEHNGMTHRALVVSKPSRAAFTAEISKRMRRIARHYFTEMLLLYVHDKKIWHRVDLKTGKLTEFTDLKPGKIPIDKLYKPITIPSIRLYSHKYRKRFEPAKKIIQVTANLLEDLTKTLSSPPRSRKKYRRKRS